MNTLRNTGQRTPQNAPFARRVMLGTACAALAVAAVGCGDDATDEVATATDVTTAEAAQTATTSDPPTTAAPTTNPPEPPPTTTEEAPDPNIELAAQIAEMLTEALAPGSIGWDRFGVDVPPTAMVAAVRVPGRDDVVVAVGENIDGTPVDADAPFGLAHLATSLVKTVAFQLIDEGVLDPARTVDEWVPTLPNADRVTVQMLIDDATGWGDYDYDSIQPVVSDFARAWSLRESVELLATSTPALDEPGTRTDDNFTNEHVLGLVVEEAGGQPLADLVRDRVAGPAGLDDTGLGGTSGFPAGFRHGVFAFEGTPVDTSLFDPTSYLTWEQATYSAVSTPTDLLDLLDAWASGELFTTDRTPAPQRYVTELGDDGNPTLLVGNEVPFNGFCPCTEVDDGFEPSAFGRAPQSEGSLTYLLHYTDGISVVVNVNTSNAADASDLESVANEIHDLAAAGAS
jgi:CubicO group peptidase (beta-lactamase class C family)